MKVEITNLQERHETNEAALQKLTEWLMEHASSMDRSKNWIECSVVLVDSDKMAELNKSALNHDGTTDVITFAYPTSPGEEQGWRGEVVVNAELAHELGDQQAGGPDRELALYLAHGCQHLGGADDKTCVEQKAMNDRQSGWLDMADSEGLINGLYKLW